MKYISVVRFLLNNAPDGVKEDVEKGKNKGDFARCKTQGRIRWASSSQGKMELVAWDERLTANNFTVGWPAT